MKNLCIIGPGNIGSRMITRLTESGYAGTLTAYARRSMDPIANIAVSTDLAHAMDGADAVLVCVKPGDVPDVAATCADILAKRVLISVAAGVTTTKLVELFRTQHVIRAMPNTPLVVGKGITAWYAHKDCPEDAGAYANELFTHFGMSHRVVKEPLLDACTALFGSGPAFIVLLMEAVHAQAIRHGISHRDARLLVPQLFEGTLAWFVASSNGERPPHYVELRDAVTSPAGTTAEGLYILEKGGVRAIIADAIHAAYERCRSLSS